MSFQRCLNNLVLSLTTPPAYQRAPLLEKGGDQMHKFEHYLYQTVKHIKHRLKATNQHGVHSPFVFNLLTKCLYQKPKLHPVKHLDIVSKISRYFKVDSISLDEKLTEVKNIFNYTMDVHFNKKKPFDLIYLENTDALRSINTNAVHNDSMIFIHHIHQNKAASNEWSEICAQKEYTVSIDLFYCGLLFFRKEQEKEHFIIRI